MFIVSRNTGEDVKLLWMDVGVVEYDSSTQLYTVVPLDGDPDEFEVSRYVTLDSVTIVVSLELHFISLIYLLHSICLFIFASTDL